VTVNLQVGRPDFPRHTLVLPSACPGSPAIRSESKAVPMKELGLTRPIMLLPITSVKLSSERPVRRGGEAVKISNMGRSWVLLSVVAMVSEFAIVFMVAKGASLLKNINEIPPGFRVANQD
jgi:hypothetical protein